MFPAIQSVALMARPPPKLKDYTLDASPTRQPCWLVIARKRQSYKGKSTEGTEEEPGSRNLRLASWCPQEDMFTREETKAQRESDFSDPWGSHLHLLVLGSIATTFQVPGQGTSFVTGLQVISPPSSSASPPKQICTAISQAIASVTSCPEDWPLAPP